MNVSLKELVKNILQHFVISSTSINISYKNGPMSLTKYGNVVFMSCLYDWSNLPTGSVTVGTIPQGYRPVQGCRYGETSNIMVTMFINTNGEILVYNYNGSVTSAMNGGYCGTWITAE